MRISDFGVVLDKRVYRDLEGGWKDLFNRIKWDVAKSVAKSAVGFQKGKIKARMSPTCVQGMSCMSDGRKASFGASFSRGRSGAC